MVKNLRIAFVLGTVAAIGLVFAGCATAAPVTTATAAPEAPAPAVVTEAAPPAPDAVAPVPDAVATVPDTAAVVTAPVVDDAPVAVSPGKQAIAEEERQAALKALARADEVQGKTAEKAAYRNASSVFANGERNMGKEDWDAAYFDFHSARESFELLTARVGDKRGQALEVLTRSKARAAESEAFALAADAVAPQKEDSE